MSAAALAIIPEGGAVAAPRTVPALDAQTLANGLNDEARADYFFWRRVLTPAFTCRRGLTATLQAIAAASGKPFKTVRGRYYAVRTQGAIGFVDRRLAGSAWWRVRTRRDTPTLPSCPELLALWHELYLENKRQGSGRAAYRKLLRLWQRRDARLAAIALYAQFPGWPELPEGWSYANFMRHLPEDFEVAAAKIGRARAADLRRQVLTTRVGLRIAQFLMGDDIWHDQLIHSPRLQTARPLEMHMLDLFSGCKTFWGIKAREKNEQTGRHETLNARHARLTIAGQLHLRGYRTDEIGTTLLVENGTFAVDDPLAALLHDHFGIRVEASGMEGAAAVAGQYAGRAKGNFRFKAALESLGNLIHNEMGDLPAQVGPHRDFSPEQIHGLTTYQDSLLIAVALTSPELRQRLLWPSLSLEEFQEVAAAIYDRINRRDRHELEGWRACGHYLPEYRLGKSWITRDDFLALPADAQAVLRSTLDQPGAMRERCLSPWDVWERGRRELTLLPDYGIPLILGKDMATEHGVAGGQFEFEDAEILPGATLSYGAELTTTEGRRELLRNGERFLCHVNPFALQTLFVSDARGRYLGTCQAVRRPMRGDVDAIRREMGEVRREEGRRLAELGAVTVRAGRQQLQRHKHNAAVLAQAAGPKPAASRAPTESQQTANQQLARQLAAARAQQAGDGDGADEV